MVIDEKVVENLLNEALLAYEDMIHTLQMIMMYMIHLNARVVAPSIVDWSGEIKAIQVIGKESSCVGAPKPNECCNRGNRNEILCRARRGTHRQAS